MNEAASMSKMMKSMPVTRYLTGKRSLRRLDLLDAALVGRELLGRRLLGAEHEGRQDDEDGEE